MWAYLHCAGESREEAKPEHHEDDERRFEEYVLDRNGNPARQQYATVWISLLSRHRRRHVHCAGMGVLVLKMTASPDRADVEVGMCYRNVAAIPSPRLCGTRHNSHAAL